MWRYFLRRLLQMLPGLIGTTFIIYALVFALPGDPIRLLAGGKPLSPEGYAALRHRYHMDDPLIVQYGKYLLGLFRGDFGETVNGQDVGALIGQTWKVTAQLALTAWVFELIVGVGLGVWAGLRRGGVIDTLVL